jgi:hypothetical protein
MTEDFRSSRFFFLTQNKKLVGNFDNIEGVLHEEYILEQERYDNIASYFLSRIPKNSKIIIEDYSFGSTGRVFNIAENCGHLKYRLWDSEFKFDTVPPTVIKKFATGKGNANKDKMYEAFIGSVGVDLISVFSSNPNKVSSPVSDIVDAYYIALYGLTLYRNIPIITNNDKVVK